MIPPYSIGYKIKTSLGRSNTSERRMLTHAKLDTANLHLSPLEYGRLSNVFLIE
jgi:hypothetical protein